jgi:hypothetical protein
MTDPQFPSLGALRPANGGRAVIGQTIRVLGILIGTLSIVSLTVDVFSIGLRALLLDLVQYYRDLASLTFGLPAGLLGWSAPQPLVDVWSLSFLGATAYVSTPGIASCRALRGLGFEELPLRWRIGLLVSFGFCGLGIGFLVGVANPLTYVDDFQEEPLDLMKGTAVNLALMIAGAVIFFSLNALVIGSP